MSARCRVTAADGACWTLQGRRPIVPPRRASLSGSISSACEPVPVLKSIFTWWNGATIGVRWHIGRNGLFVGEDEFGNKYYEAKTDRDSYDGGRKRRWVTYNGYAEASKVPPDWHGWLHYTFDEPPTKDPQKRRSWERDHIPNLTGSVLAWRPPGSITRGGERSPATGDYEAWTPE